MNGDVERFVMSSLLFVVSYCDGCQERPE